MKKNPYNINIYNVYRLCLLNTTSYYINFEDGSMFCVMDIHLSYNIIPIVTEHAKTNFDLIL